MWKHKARDMKREPQWRREDVIVFPELRALQVDMLSASPEITALCLGRKWDLGDTPLPPGAIELSTFRALFRLWSFPPAVLEVPEPLFVRELPRSLLLAAGARLGGLLSGRPVVVVTYAIENNDLQSLVGLPGIRGRWVARAIRPILALLVAIIYGRVIFGSPSAQRAYARVAPRFASKGTLLLELPAVDGRAHLERGQTVAFVGELANRKGLPLLMEAWPLVERAVPEARLVIAGAGPLEVDVRDWCASWSSRSFLGMVPHDEVPNLLAGARVLAAPSIREGRWREQIGRPISEALAVGVTVVTTTETGLADWLRNEGHVVLSASPSATELADGVIRALREPLDPSVVTRSLPSRHGRYSAHDALHPAGAQ
ncbi:glycosyltransferase [Nocardioides lianchengensis]|uniref:Glycosyltransferase involved in cell wall bisynthesis n=1 Tax=Nocardioides lianchengensis TaxID=1045774 RepID=A0A1G7AY34_9ACTN|nr:glycosyltransferase involved in cell wall biosynthesis [Nocardioides lianchengensis]SDE19580.1 Glycosyltransferase involved in cell wall bisynthesis [Nocardioides lianchengensis]